MQSGVWILQNGKTNVCHQWSIYVKDELRLLLPNNKGKVTCKIPEYHQLQEIPANLDKKSR